MSKAAQRPAKIYLSDADWRAIEAEYCRRRLGNFIKRAWHVLEPSTTLAWGWALDAICEHLEAVSRGEIIRLLINVPPGCMKSMTTNVFWPAWEWGPAGAPHLRYVSAAYKHELAVRDNRRCRQLIQSDWYQKLWGDRFEFASDQDAKIYFANDQQGFRLAQAVGGSTGERGDRVVLDDPHPIQGAESEADRKKVLTWFGETLPSRLNSERSAIVVIMQRLHEEDVSGHILRSELGYEHLMLPMEFEPDRRCVTSIGFQDPRTEDGELLFPELYSPTRVERLKRELRSVGGTYAEAGQLQQRPAPRAGGLFKADEFKVVTEPPAAVESVCRYWDKAGTEGGGAYTAGVKLAKLVDGSFAVLDVKRGQWSAANRERVIRETAEADGVGVPIWMEQEPGSAGKDVAHLSIKALAGFTARSDKVSGQGGKELRAEPYAAQVENGNVYLVRAPWNREFVEEHRGFPAGRYKDQVDAAAGAFNKLQRGRGQRKELKLGGGKIDNWARL